MARGVKPEITKEQLERAIWNNLRKVFTPHRGQLKILEQAFLPPYGKGMKRVFIRCGRKFGKSTIATYLSYVRALLFPGSECYLLAPLYKQAKGIYWTSEEAGLVPSFLNFEGHRSPFVTKIDNQDTRVDLFNGSFVKVDGSDNFDAQRGWNPDQVVGDEFANFHPSWLNMMIPNMASKNGTLLLIGTPPEYPILEDGTEHQYVRVDREWRDRMAQDKAFWLHAPSTANTAVFSKPEMKEWLETERESLQAQNLSFVFDREYNAEIVFGGAQAVFPGFSPSIHMLPHNKLLESLKGKKLDYWVGADPGSASVFAVNFFAIDHSSGTPYWLDEVHVEDRVNVTTDYVIPLIKKKMSEFHEGDWGMVCDSASTWFIEEANRPGNALSFMAAHKQRGDKKEGITMLRELFRVRTGVISDRCVYTKAEILNYRTNDKGMYIKLRDHHIDLARYVLKASDVEVFGRKEQEKKIDFDRGGRYLYPPKPDEFSTDWPQATGSIDYSFLGTDF